jgi:hypothetical protein
MHEIYRKFKIQANLDLRVFENKDLIPRNARY